MMKRCSALAVASILAVGGGCHHDDDDDVSGPFDPSDFTVDGLAEIAVGAPFDDAGTPGSNTGAVHLYRGGTRAFMGTLAGGEAESRFGFAVAAAGDVNGDGFPDLAVGAPLDDADGAAGDSADDRGRVFIYLGGVPFPKGVIVLSGGEIGGQFGYSVARAGDVNGDGRDDVVVGAPFEDGGGTDRGRAHLFLGGNPMSTAPALSMSGSEDFSRFGFSVSTAGDYNRDGWFDWMVGAPRDDNDGVVPSSDGWDRGRVFVYRGSAFPDNGVDLVLSGQEDFAEFGYSVAGVLDIDDDGWDDLLVGAPFDDADGSSLTALSDRGRAYLFFGSSVASVSSAGAFSANRIMSGTEDGAMFGALVSRIGDINSGGAPDFFVGAPMEDADGNSTDDFLDRGRGYVYFGGPLVDTTADIVLTGQEPGAELGWAASSGGDVDGDGHRDLVVGAPFDDADGNAVDDGLDNGRAYFYQGGFALDSTPDTTFNGAETGASFGTGVQ